MRNDSALSPYPAGFCRQSAQPPERNYNKINILRRTAQNGDPKLAANSLFSNILRVSPSGSGFCRESRRSSGHNINEMSILASQEEKNDGDPLLRFLNRPAQLPLTEPLHFRRHGVLQLLDPFARHCGDLVELQLMFLAIFLELRQLVFIHRINL